MATVPAQTPAAPAATTRRTPAPHGRLARLRGNEVAVAACISAFCAGLVFLLAHRALADDSYISLSYARNLALHGHWGLTEFRTSNTATSPLNVWLLAGLIVLTRAPVVSAGLLLMASIAALAAWSTQLRRLVGASWLLPAAAVGLLLVNPLLLSTIGLELYLAAALLAGLVRYAVAGRPVATGVIAGLLALTRPDLVVVDLAVLVALPRIRRRLLRVVPVAALIVLPWHVFSWFALGSAIPDTFAFKTQADHFGEEAGTMVTVVAGLLCVLGWAVARSRGVRHVGARVAIAFALAGLAHWAVLAFALRPVPHIWYFAPLVTGLALATAVTVGVIHAQVPKLAAACASSVVVVVAVTLGVHVGGPLPWDSTPIPQNWAYTSSYTRAAQELNAELPQGATVRSPGEIGVLAFFCDCDIVDAFSDRGDAKAHIDDRMRSAGPVLRRLLELNYLNLPDAKAVETDYRLYGASPQQPGGVHRWRMSHALIDDWDLVLDR